MRKPSLTRVKVTTYIDIPDLGSRIRAARKLKGVPPTMLAAEAGLSLPRWYGIEQDRSQDAVPIETLQRIERTLGVSFMPDSTALPKAEQELVTEIPPVGAKLGTPDLATLYETTIGTVNSTSKRNGGIYKKAGAEWQQTTEKGPGKKCFLWERVR